MLDEDLREEIARRLERRADHYSNAGDLDRAQGFRDAAESARGADSLDAAQGIEQSALAAGQKPNFWGRLWSRLRGGSPSDDS